ncbi:MAG: acyl-CoA/acyl-ACP dehydrogenase [Gammaproteobacteria bacterium]|nr:acyl-CoA/acyl-ACP dehydrogenase [Gammaproteobacteria bacterium]
MQIQAKSDLDNFRDQVARFMSGKSPTTEVRRLMATDTGYDVGVWQQLCGELGLAGIAIPESYGGFGFGPVELGIVAEQMGRHLYCGPFFASAVMAAGALLMGGSEKAREALLPGIAAGTTIATLVLENVGNLERPDQCFQTSGGNTSRLSGQAPIVLDAGIADLLLVMTGTADTAVLYAIDPGAQGVEIRSRQSLDETRKLSSISLDEVLADRVGSFDASQLAQLWDYLSAILAREMMGGAQVLMDSTVEYTRLRYQFGRPIGSFQGLKHRCADQLMELELAKAATEQACVWLAGGEGEACLASMAKAMASDAYMNTARMAIQLRGGIGFTWEDDTHLWFKRAKSAEVFLGSPQIHRERMMRMMEKQP